jgi:hypothetical protein
LGHTDIRLTVSWVRHLCQLAPGRFAPTAPTSPVCASEVTSATPLRSRATRS